MFTEINFPCEVLIHHNVVVVLLPHFIVPEEHTAELKLKYMSQASIPPLFFKQDHLLKYINIEFQCIHDDRCYCKNNELKLKLSEVYLPQMNPNTSTTFITLEAEKEQPAYPVILLNPYVFICTVGELQSSDAKIIFYLEAKLSLLIL